MREETSNTWNMLPAIVSKQPEAIVIPPYVATYHLPWCRERGPPPGWLSWPKNKPIDYDHLSIEWLLGDCLMLKEASQICPIYMTRVLKHLRSNGWSSLWHTTPFAIRKGVHLAGPGRKLSQLIPAVWAYSGALEVGWWPRMLLRHATCLQNIFWNTSEAMAIPPYVTTHHLPCEEGHTLMTLPAVKISQLIHTVLSYSDVLVVGRYN